VTVKRFLALILLLVAGCARAPFRDTALVPQESSDPRVVVERFRSGNPESFQLLNTIVFEYNWFSFGGIGFVEINAADHFYKVACMNHMGVKLFEVSGNRNGVLSQSAIGPLADRGDIARAVGNDIMRIYFDLVPGPHARIWKRRKKLFFQESSGNGRLEYVFAGERGDLIEKNYYDDDGIVWRASYYEYRDQSGKRWPQGIVFINYQYGYRLTVRQKELRT
jgi:hypothetical protein